LADNGTRKTRRAEAQTLHRAAPCDSTPTVVHLDAGAFVAGRYRILHPVGSGGFGLVYKAVQESLGRTVAVKVVHSHHKPKVRRLFQQEAIHLARLQHPHVLEVLDAGEWGECLYIVTEFLEGDDLGAWIRCNGPVPASTALHMASQIASALAEVHEAGLLHGDLKPGNVLRSPRRTDPDFVKIIDFGISSVLGQRGETAGTLTYMAPEQLRGESLLPAADVYGLGLVLYELIAGEPRFANLMARSRDVAPPRTGHAGIDDLLQKLCAVDPADRPADGTAAFELVSDLAHARPAPPISRSTAAPRALHGRDSELTRLLGVMQEALEADKPALVILGGHRGVGKRTLARHAIDHMRTSGHMVAPIETATAATAVVWADDLQGELDALVSLLRGGHGVVVVAVVDRETLFDRDASNLVRKLGAWSGTTLLEVPPLPGWGMVHVVREAMARAGVTETPKDVRRIVRAAAGLPLAALAVVDAAASGHELRLPPVPATRLRTDLARRLAGQTDAGELRAVFGHLCQLSKGEGPLPHGVPAAVLQRRLERVGRARAATWMDKLLSRLSELDLAVENSGGWTPPHGLWAHLIEIDGGADADAWQSLNALPALPHNTRPGIPAAEDQ
jgi:hypothetical protein